MKIWISKNSEVPVREQLIVQITLGIAAGDLKIGEKLPSTREVARRCDLHSNTVGSAYQKLVDEKLLEFKKGSGFYVAESADARIEGTRQLERLAEEFLASAKALGFDTAEVIALLKKPRRSGHTGGLVVVESDRGLREIIIHELAERFPKITGATLEEFTSGKVHAGSILVAMLDEKPKLEPHLAGGQRCVYLKGRSVSAAMSGQARPSADQTVAVVSGWDGFLSFARIMLLAAKVDPGNLIVRSTREDGWDDSIQRASIIICDSLTFAKLHPAAPSRQFQIISEESFEELAALLG
ncbi:MAG TPA: GntR family transcriptional regulator [Pyrinomonadaceae bacterium]|nr:GntR family transcriptional regulator [Pyrinomonadaceae bacterium]